MAQTKLAFIADIHYYSPKLGITGRAYELRSGSDQKCLAESGAIVDAAFDRLLKEAHVVTTPGAGFGPSGEGYIRVTAFGDAEDTKEAVRRILDLLK